METLPKSSKPKSIGIPKALLISWIIVALIGFIDATYLTVSHYQGGGVNCSVTKHCDDVLTSDYATVAGIPVSLGGALYYLFMLLGGIFYWDRKNNKVMKFFAWFSIVGLITSVALVSIMAFVIQAFCQYCLLSALTSSLLFIFGMIVLNKLKVKSKNNEP